MRLVTDARANMESATHHTKRAAEMLGDWVKIKTKMQTGKITKTGAQIAMSAVLGLFALVWAEVTLFFALASAMARPWAALLVLIFNGLAIVGLNFAIQKWKLKTSHVEELNEKKTEFRGELITAKQDLTQIKDEFIDTGSELVQQKVVVPLQRYKKPIAIVGTFAAGVALARAIFPEDEQHLERHRRISEEDLRRLI